MNSKSQTIGQGFLILAMSNIIVKLLSLVFVPVIRLTLGGDSAYSVYSSAYSVYALVYVLATAGFPTAISKIISEFASTNNSKEAKTAFKYASSIVLGASFLMTLIIAVFCKPIASLMNNEDSWAGILHLAPTVFVCGILSCLRGYFQGKKNMRPTALSQVFEQMVHLVMSLNMVYLMKGKGLVWAVAGASLGTLFGAIAATAYCGYQFYKEKDYFSERIAFEEEARSRGECRSYTNKDLLRYIFYIATPTLLAASVQFGGDLIDSTLIKGSLEIAGLTKSASQVLHGQYMAMKQLINVPGSLATALCVSALPAIASKYAKNDLAGVSQNTQFSLKLCYAVSVPIACIYAVYSGPIYKLLGYGDNNILLTLSSLSCILLCTVHLQSSILQGANRMYISSIYMILCVVLKTVLNLVLVRIPSINILGAIIATYVSYLIPMILNFIAIKRAKIEFNFLTAICPSLISSVLGVALSYLIYFGINYAIRLLIKGFLSYLIPFVISGFVFVVIYYYVMRMIKGISDDDIKQISPAFGKICGIADKILLIKMKK